MNSPLLQILSPFPIPKIEFGSGEFSRCVACARQHGVEMLFYNRLKKHYAGANDDIDGYLKQNENFYLMAIAASMRQELVEKDVMAVLAKNSIPACIIKGNAIARTIYDDPNSRSSADIDVLIKTTDLVDADSILHEIGFARNDSLPLSFVINRLHHLVYHHEKKACHLELHWDFVYPLYFNLTPDKIWEGVVGSASEGYSLTPENMVIMLLTHHFRHGFRELKILVDILWSLYRYEKMIDWYKFAEQLKEFGMIKTTKITIQQLESVWNLKEDRLESYKLLRKQLDSMPLKPPAFLLHYFRMAIESKIDRAADMQMAKLVLDKKSKIFYSFVKIFFPRTQDIQSLYPKTGKWMLPFNYLRFMIWRVKQSIG